MTFSLFFSVSDMTEMLKKQVFQQYLKHRETKSMAKPVVFNMHVKMHSNRNIPMQNIMLLVEAQSINIDFVIMKW